RAFRFLEQRILQVETLIQIPVDPVVVIHIAFHRAEKQAVLAETVIDIRHRITEWRERSVYQNATECIDRRLLGKQMRRSCAGIFEVIQYSARLSTNDVEQAVAV